MEEAYGRPVAPETLRQVEALPSAIGFTSMFFPRRQGDFDVAYERGEEFGLVAASFVPRGKVVSDWLERSIPPTLLLFVYFFGSLWAYRRSAS